MYNYHNYHNYYDYYNNYNRLKFSRDSDNAFMLIHMISPVNGYRSDIIIVIGRIMVCRIELVQTKIGVPY